MPIFAALRHKSLPLFLGIILLATTLAYVIATNVVASRAFKLREVRGRIEDLHLKNKKAETELADRESMARLEEEARRMGLVPIGRVKFMDPPGGAVAVK